LRATADQLSMHSSTRSITSSSALTLDRPNSSLASTSIEIDRHASFIYLNNFTLRQYLTDLTWLIAVLHGVLFHTDFDQYQLRMKNTRRDDTVHIPRQLALSSERLLSLDRIFPKQLVFYLVSSANRTNLIGLPLNTYFATLEAHLISALPTWQNLDIVLLLAVQMQTGEAIWTNDALQSAMSSRSMAELLPGRVSVNQRLLCLLPRQSAWHQQMQHNKQSDFDS